jgi:hypothetical protein
LESNSNLQRGWAMKLKSLMLRNSFLFLTLLAIPAFRATAQSKPDAAVTAAAQSAAIPARITQAIDETQLVRLKGNVHPLARPEFDQGIVADATPMKRMMLLLQRSPEQQTALSKFMDEQQSKDSPNFHKWLTPDQFGKLYGPADVDLQAVTSWLASHGFAGMGVNRGKTVIEFDGNVGQVRNAFHTDVHKFVVNGENRQANTSDPHIPAALTPVVAGIVSLHNFPSHSMRHVVGEFTHSRATGETTPQFTGTNNAFFALGPADFAKIYNIPASLDGTGAKIAIVGFSSIDLNDVRAFRTLFGLPANDPVIVNNGPDPGFNGEEGEADLDVQWSGSVAPKAQIDYVLSEGTLTADPIILSAEYVVDNNSDEVMSLSFGVCEAGLSTQNATFKSLWEQAAAQGITVTVSAGDNGSAGCDDFNTSTTATGGIAVNGIASTPFNIAVGGTDFDDVGTQISGGFWSAANSMDGKRESALGYIHEVPWNDSCAATATPTNLTTCAGALANNIVAASGGPSSLYAKPPWQNGITPNGIAAGDNHRYLPDVSLFASDGPSSKSFYVVCEADAVQNPATSCVSTGSFSFLGVGGTSASSPSFAAIVALVGQSEFNAGRSRRQGNANLVLYKLGQTASNFCNSTAQPLAPPATCVFYDVTKGNNSVPCAGTSSGCSSTTAGTNGVLVTVNGATKTPAFSTTAGTGAIPSYDLATGLGTVNVANLATAWGTAVGAFKGTTTTLKINGSSTPATIAHGTPVTAAVTVAVVSPATGTPTGDFSILPANATANGGTASNTGTLAGSPTTLNGVLLPGGSVSVTAHYAGDGTFAPSDSAVVPITVTPENSRLQMEIVTFDSNGNVTSANATTFPYGSPYILRMDVLDHTTNACTLNVTALGCAFDATGTITLTDNGSPLDGGSFKINSQGHAEDQPINLGAGAHTLSASYSGDASYNASGPITDAVTVTQAATATSLASSAATVTTGQTVTLTATIATQSLGVGPSGTATFSTCGTPPCTATLIPTGFNPNTGTFAFATASLPTVFTTTGTKSITATYAGDTNYTGSGPSTAVTVTVTSSGTFTVGGTAATATAGASGTSTITVTPTGGFTGNVNVTCPAAALPAGVTCTPNPLAINVTGPAVTGQLTVNVAAPSTTLTASTTPASPMLYAAGMYAAGAIPSSAGKGWWTLSATTGLAALFLLILPGRKRYRVAVGLGLVCVLSFGIGCGGYGGGGGGGPVATITKITVNSAKLASNDPTGFKFTINVTASVGANGQVQLFDGAAALGAAVAVSNGTAAITNAGLAPGTHSISAHYLGDTYTQASNSGTLNITSTGTTTFAITATPAASNGSPTVNITIN